MTPENFTYWLKSFVERQSEPPGEEQWKIIKTQLETVCIRKRPSFFR